MKEKSVKINLILNTVKQCCSISFPLITFPYVSRILGATNYGKYNFSYSIINYFILIAGLGISTYSIREGARIKNDRQQLETFISEVFSINIVTTVLSYCLLFLLIILIPGMKPYISILLVESLNIILTTIGLDWINNIFEDFLYITIRYIIFHVIALILIFVLVKDQNDYISYALISCIANVGGNLCNVFYIRKYVNIHTTKRLNIKKHYKSILILFCNTLAVMIFVNSDTTLLGIFSNETEVGVYSIPVKIYSMAKQILNALIVVIIPRLSNLIGTNNKQQYNSLLEKTIKALLTFTIPLSVGLFMLSREAIEVTSGAEFISGTLALRILSISIIFATVSCIFNVGILVPNRREKFYLKATIIAACTNLGLNFLMIPLWGLNGAACTTLIAEAVVMYFGIRYAKGYYHINTVLPTMISTIIGSMGIVFICLITKALIANVVLRSILAVVLSCIVFLVIEIHIKNDIIVQSYQALVMKLSILRKRLS